MSIFEMTLYFKLVRSKRSDKFWCASGNLNSIIFHVGIKLKNWSVFHPCLLEIPALNKKCLTPNAVPVSASVMKCPLPVDNLSGSD